MPREPVATRALKRAEPDAGKAVKSDKAPVKRKRSTKASKVLDEEEGSTYYLLKTEPDDLSADRLEAAPKGIATYDGVRGFQARNYMKQMKAGNQVFFYHSSCKVPGIYAMAEVVAEAYPDHHAWTEGHKYYDPKRLMVDLQFKRKFNPTLTLADLKQHATEGLSGMPLLNQPRLSVQPVTDTHANFIFEIEKRLSK
eukprot:gene19913-26617_t